MAGKKGVKQPSRPTTPRKVIRVPDVPPIAEFNIVGVGGSAGGFEAFSQVLQSLPPNPNIALIFVQHLAPHHGSALSTLLSNYTNLRVVEASEGARVAPNVVYVVPPNVQMELTEGCLHLGPRPTDITQHTPIDFFFRSLARTLRHNSIGVVLSGTASDGSLGVREIKTMGGITIAQDPATAKYDGMPRAAIATQAIDLVLAPKDIGPKLLQIAESPLLGSKRAGPQREESRPATVTEGQLERVFKRLMPACGIDFVHYKTPTIIRRLLRRMTLLRLPDIDSYIAYLEQTPDEVVKLHNDLLIHVTRFFREPDSFDLLAREVVPHLEIKADAPIRAWVAGCATGEEAYSLAIVLHEVLGERIQDARVQIFGTDVSESAVEYARHGFYPTTIAADVSPDRLRRFFVKSDGGYRVTNVLRDMCVFARQDLTRDPPFSRLDLICCRNVLIYMDGRLQKKLLSMCHYALKPSGVLLLGHAETIGYHSDLFSFMDKKHRMFRKKPGAVAPENAIGVPPPPARHDDAAHRITGGASQTRRVLNEANRIVIDRFAPPSVLLDQNFHVIQFNGQTGFFLEASPGEPSFHVLKLAREGLLHGLRTALQTVRKTRHAARRQGCASAADRIGAISTSR
jgi:two-component system CheB/CheR fusion protein